MKRDEFVQFKDQSPRGNGSSGNSSATEDYEAAEVFGYNSRRGLQASHRSRQQQLEEAADPDNSQAELLP